MNRKNMIITLSIGSGILIAILATVFLIRWMDSKVVKPEVQLKKYMLNINKSKYEDMYNMLDKESKSTINKNDFISRNKKIYENINRNNLEINIRKIYNVNRNKTKIEYDTSMDTYAGKITFSNVANFKKENIKGKGNEYLLNWSSKLILPNLENTDKVDINMIESKRGDILDRNGTLLAGEGVGLSIGIIPKKMNKNSKDDDIKEISKILDISVELINSYLDASYVTEDMFIPIDLISSENKDIENSLINIDGVRIDSVPIRVYPLGEKSAQLIGYIQSINADELTTLSSNDYTENSIIGKTGIEKIYESKLRGINGYEINILDENDNLKEVFLKKDKKDGETVRLTIDSKMQSDLYNKFEKDKSSSVVMNPKTGEVMALVSTPSYNPNDFILGLSQKQWDDLNNDQNKPLNNRFQSTLIPGSSFKPVIAGIGVSNGKIDPNKDYGISGTSWQENASWGNYKITTIDEYESPYNLQNALIYSDNIYFAKSSLNIGSDLLSKELKKIGFDETMPFEYPMYNSTFSNSDKFESDIQLADSGYGQGEILVNSIHMASIYSSFVNSGNMVNPYLIYKEDKLATYWINDAFTQYAAEVINKDLVEVIEKGTGKGGKIDNVLLAGKTGTAEIKKDQTDTTGTELGWFYVFTADPNEKNPLLIITMVEDVKNRNGSHYVVDNLKPILEKYLIEK